MRKVLLTGGTGFSGRHCLPALAVGEPKLLAADVSRLRNDVCWSPRYALDAGLDATVSWWRQQMVIRRDEVKIRLTMPPKGQC